MHICKVVGKVVSTIKDDRLVGTTLVLVQKAIVGNGGKLTFQCVCGKEAVAKGVKAGDIIRQITAICGGKGGGRPDSAMGGGNDASKCEEALALLMKIVEETAK